MAEKAKPAGVSGGHREMLVTEWKPFTKNTLQGFLCLSLQGGGLVIRDFTLHEKNGARWIGLPARQYAKDDGTTSYSPLIEFATQGARQRFQEAALAAVDHYMEGAHE